MPTVIPVVHSVNLNTSKSMIFIYKKFFAFPDEYLKMKLKTFLGRRSCWLNRKRKISQSCPFKRRNFTTAIGIHPVSSIADPELLISDTAPAFHFFPICT